MAWDIRKRSRFRGGVTAHPVLRVCVSPGCGTSPGPGRLRVRNGFARRGGRRGRAVEASLPGPALEPGRRRRVPPTAAEAPPPPRSEGLRTARRLLGNRVRAPGGPEASGKRRQSGARLLLRRLSGLRADTGSGDAAASSHRKCPIRTGPVGEVSPGLGTEVPAASCPLNTQPLLCPPRDCSSLAAP